MIDFFLMIYIIFSRVFELLFSHRNTKKLLEEGAVEYFKFHYFFIVIFHIIFILFFLIKSFYNSNVVIEYFYAFMVLQILRYKIIYELGIYWTTRIIVIEKPLINTWIFKYFRHPNYIVVFLEVVFVCLFFDDFIALVFFVSVNSILLGIRIFFEEKANRYRRKI